MEIQELVIKKYGKFTDYSLTLQPGVNIIYGGNESGKSTIHSFIRAMLFGLSRGRGRAAKRDEYQLRQPWDSPGAFLGSMRIRENGAVYRIDRCFDRRATPPELVCETDAAESENPEEDLQALLGGISETAFVNSVFIPQAQCETDEALAQELRRYMLNSSSTMDAELDVTRTLQELRKKKKQQEQKKKKEDASLEDEIGQKQSQAEMLRSELELLRSQAERYPGGSAAGQPNRGQDSRGMGRSSEREENDVADSGVSPVMRRLLCGMLAVAGALTLAGAFLLEGQMVHIFLGVFTAIFWGMALLVLLLFGGGREEEEAVRPNQVPHTDCPPELLREIRMREEKYRKLQDELELLYQRHVRPEGTDTEIAALTLAIDRICELSDSIYQANGGRLNEIASMILEEITEGRYNRIIMDDTGEVRIHTPSRVLGLHQVSGGTLQQIYFALRMAAGELFCGETKLPVILDETFAMYDDRRLEAALRWLKQSGRQVIVFTCQNREREILSRI